jgi:tape measure domain-containing protein
MAGYELATAYVNLVTSTGGMGRQLQKTFNGVQKDASRAGASSGRSFANAFSRSKPIDVREDVKRAAANVEVASKRVKSARTTEEAAARKVKIAEAQLDELRESGTAKASELLAAEDKLAGAKQRHALASENVISADEAATKATETYKSATEAADKALKGGAASSTSFADKVKGAFANFHANAVSQVDIVGQKIKTGFGTAAKAAGLALASIVGASVVKGWNRLTAIENATAKLKGLGNSAKDVEGIMANALNAVKGTSFGLDEAATTAAGAVAAGIKPGQELEGVLKSVANSAAASGIGMDEMGSIYNKVASTGKAQNDVLQQVADRGLPIYQALADQLGVTADEVFKMASAGEIGFGEFEQAMTSASGTVADELGKTTTGTLSNLWAALARFGQGILSGVFPAIAPLFAGMTEKLDAMSEVVGPLAEAVGVKLVAGIKATVAWLQKWWPLLAVIGSGLAGYAVTIGVVRAATTAWAAVQWALNAALTANPIGLIIAGIAALVAGVIIAYNKIGWFRTGVNAAWAGIRIAVGAVVGWFQTYVWPVLAAVWKGIAAGATWLWRNAIAPAFNGIKLIATGVAAFFRTYVQPALVGTTKAIGNVFSWLWKNIAAPVFAGIRLIISTWWAGVKIIFSAVVRFVKAYLVPVFQLFQAVSKVVWAAVRAVIAAAWGFIRDKVFAPIVAFVKNRLIPIFNAYRSANAAVWSAIRNAISVAWNFIRDKVFSPIVTWVRDHLQARFRLLRATVLTVWAGIRSTIASVWNFIRDKVFSPLKTAISSAVPAAFRKGKDAIANAWNKVRDVAKKPVKFVIETIINKGIVGNFNKIASKFGVKKMPPVKLPAGFDRGGWTGSGPWNKPAGVVHADEFVLRKKSRRKLERQVPGALDYMNSTGRFPMLGGYAGGGMVWNNLWAIVKKQFKGVRLHSSYRPGAITASGNKSYHSRGMAIDITPDMKIFNWLHDTFGQSKELIFSPANGRQIKNGRHHKYTGAVRSMHFNHIHWANDKRFSGATAGASGAASGGGVDLSTFLNPFSKLKDKVAGGVKQFGAFGDLVGGGAKKMISMPIQWIKDNVSRVADIVSDAWNGAKEKVVQGTAKAQGKAWALANGITGARWKATDFIISRESGWNPKAKNPRSSAAGLPQFIAANQRHYGVYPIRQKSVWKQLDAFMKYVKDRFGGVLKAEQYWRANHHYSSGGRVVPTTFDNGGILGPGVSLVENKTRRPEYILPAHVTDSLLAGNADRAESKLAENLTVQAFSMDDALRKLEVRQRRREALSLI